MQSIRTLMDGALDYAGLFPPAKLEMGPTVRNYAAYRDGPESWMLSRLIVPIARLEEFERYANELLPVSSDPASDDCWCISALTVPAGDDDFEKDIEALGAFNERHLPKGTGAALIDTIETRVTEASDVDRALDLVPETIFPFFEVDHHTDVRGMVAAMSGLDAGAKIRTGGVTPELHPEPDELARFILACAGAEVPFKATAGLHHPLRHHSRIVGCEQFGFLNVIVGACLAWTQELDEASLVKVLLAESADSFDITEDSMGFDGQVLTLQEIERSRERFFHGFGSCSFEEPLDDLVGLDLLRRDAAAT